MPRFDDTKARHMRGESSPEDMAWCIGVIEETERQLIGSHAAEMRLTRERDEAKRLVTHFKDTARKAADALNEGDPFSASGYLSAILVN